MTSAAMGSNQGSGAPERPARPFRVGIRLPEWSRGHTFRFFEGLTEIQRTSAAMALHFNHTSDGDLPAEPIDAGWRGDGLLVHRYTLAEAKAWGRRGIPVVSLSTDHPGRTPHFPRVTMDNHLVGRLAADHLLALGLGDFAYVHESSRRYSSERGEGFRERVLEAGGRHHRIDVPASTWSPAERPARIEQSMRESLLALPRPCGILTKDDIAGVWTLRLMRKLGLSCPDEMPVLGITDDLYFCHTTDPPLSSIPYPGRQIGLVAAHLLARMMGGETIGSGHRELIPPLPVVARESTRQVVLSDPVVTCALQVIQQQAPQRPIRVTELTRTVGVSREILRQRFQATLGCSPKQHIERIRLGHVTNLLRTTGDSLEVLAAGCGFSGADDLCRFVRRLTGKTPGSIRREDRASPPAMRD